MKWKNKGHEFDRYQNFFKEKSIYIYGAGNNGKRLYDKMFYLKDCMRGFIDRNKKAVPDVNILNYSEIDENIVQNSIVIISTNGELASHMAIQLRRKGFKFGETFFFYREWENFYLYIYSLIKKNLVVAPCISLQFSNVCNLNCSGCLASTPNLKHKKYFGINIFKENVDALFKNIDILNIVDVCGGEPLLVKDFANVLEYIGSNYRNQIYTLQTIINGTIIPSDDLCEILHKYDVMVWLDDYRKSDVGKRLFVDDIVEKFDKYCVKHDIRSVDHWIDLNIESNPICTTGEAEARFDECANEIKSIHNMKLYSCDYADYANEAGVCIGDTNDYLDLGGAERIDTNIVSEFLMGYTENGFCEMCKKCSGSQTINQNYIPVARQLLK